MGITGPEVKYNPGLAQRSLPSIPAGKSAPAVTLAKEAVEAAAANEYPALLEKLLLQRTEDVNVLESAKEKLVQDNEHLKSIVKVYKEKAGVLSGGDTVLKTFLASPEFFDFAEKNLHSCCILFDGLSENPLFTEQVQGLRAVFTSAFGFDPKRVTINKKMGEGAQGFVYDGLWYDRTVAVKFAIDSKAESIAALEKEAGLLQRLSHQNIIGFLGKGLFRVGDQLLQGLCMERAMQGDAKTYIQFLFNSADHFPLSPSDLQRVGTELSSALAYLHGANILHKDVRAANILVDEDGKFKFSDFGISSVMANGETGVRPSYMPKSTTAIPVSNSSPEARENTELTDASDVYSFGMMILEFHYLNDGQDLWMVIGEDGKSRYMTVAEIERVSFKTEHHPLHKVLEAQAPIKRILERSFLFDPEKRPTMLEVLDVFAATEPDQGGSSTATSTHSFFYEGLDGSILVFITVNTLLAKMVGGLLEVQNDLTLAMACSDAEFENTSDTFKVLMDKDQTGQQKRLSLDPPFFLAFYKCEGALDALPRKDQKFVFSTAVSRDAKDASILWSHVKRLHKISGKKSELKLIPYVMKYEISSSTTKTGKSVKVLNIGNNMVAKNTRVLLAPWVFKKAAEERRILNDFVDRCQSYFEHCIILAEYVTGLRGATSEAAAAVEKSRPVYRPIYFPPEVADGSATGGAAE